MSSKKEHTIKKKLNALKVDYENSINMKVLGEFFKNDPKENPTEQEKRTMVRYVYLVKDDKYHPLPGEKPEKYDYLVKEEDFPPLSDEAIACIYSSLKARIDFPKNLENNFVEYFHSGMKGKDVCMYRRGWRLVNSI